MAHTTHKCTKIRLVHLGEVYGVYIIGFDKLLLVVFVCFLITGLSQGQGPRESAFNLEVKPACVSTQDRWEPRGEPFLP